MLAILLTPTRSGPPLTLPDGKPLAAVLREQLRAAGARDVVLTDDLAELAVLAGTAREPVLLCSGDLVAHTAVLRHLGTSPMPGTVALVLPDPDAGPVAVLEDRGQVVAAGPAGTLGVAPTGASGGAVRVSVADLPALVAAARALAETETETETHAHARTHAENAAGTVGAGIPGAGTVAAGTSGAGTVAAGTSGAGTVAAGTPGATSAALDRLLAELARPDSATGPGITIFTSRVRLLVARRVADAAELAEAEAAVAAVDSDRAELRLSVKEKDDFFTTYFVSTWSPWVTKLSARLRLTPTGVTAISVAFAVAAAVLFALGGRPALVAGAILLYLGFMLDCVDGQLARYTRHFSPWGGWLDTLADRAKEYLVYAGLAVGVERAGGPGWALGIAAITLQTVRHMTDTWYGALHDEAAKRPRTAGPGGPGGLGDRLSQASNRVQADTGSLTYWLKRTVVFPIGERWALIALTVAIFSPLVSLVAVLVWGGLAAAYTLALRTLRARSMRVPVLTRVDTMLHRDDGPAARWLAALGRSAGLSGPLPLAVLAAGAGAALLGAGLAGLDSGHARWAVPLAVLVVLLAGLPAAVPHAGALDWLVPAALRAAEYLLVIATGVLVDADGAVIFALLFALALRHYDLTARLEKRERAPLLGSLGLGWDGRLIVLSAAVLVGPAAGRIVMLLLAGYLLAIFVVNALRGWVPRDVPGPRQPSAAETRTDGQPGSGDALAVAGAREGYVPAGGEWDRGNSPAERDRDG
ncbi:CDP-alcohol phosphatidyltransferase family protein [Plantactinospora sp. S1510]|uniref:CDP-alcohol phosphatidyltransferase family protein n=1 Tax=Plantactinospora alkalitolerans TaxID=2789879 RepID=A0ABS0GVG9_9ACTN|nr:CDP-alcohol phosphatidyltransferase family protein [Plantactinospora alkalitolerans]